MAKSVKSNLTTDKFFGEFLFRAAENYPDKLALSDMKRAVSYSELINEIKKATTLLINSSVSKSDRVIVMCGNTIEQMVFHYAVMLNGFVSVPLAFDLAEEQLMPYLKDTSAKLIVSSTGIYDENNTKISDLADFKDLAPVESINFASRLNIASIMYTTGSTGYPKGVVLNHETLLNSLLKITTFVPYDENTKELVILPVFHSFGLGHVYSTHIHGGSVFLLNGLLKAKRVFKTLQEEKITHFPATPTIVELFLNRYLDIYKKSIETLSVMVVNSAPLHPDQSKALLEVHPGLKLIVYYGLTEASRSTFMTVSDQTFSDYHKVGPGNIGVEIKLTDEMEVCIKGSHLFVSYWNRPEDTEKAMLNGWFHTGDTGEFDEEGRLTITGRIKDQINIGGLKVSSQTVEKVLRSHELVADVSVAGVEDKLYGQVVAALIVLKENKIEESDLIKLLVKFCGESLEPFMLPKIIRFTNEIPTGLNGKIARKEVLKCLM